MFKKFATRGHKKINLNITYSINLLSSGLTYIHDAGIEPSLFENVDTSAKKLQAKNRPRRYRL